MLCLFHFDMPKVLQDLGGFENIKVVEKYVKYAKICFEHFGDLADYWVTFNEPIVPTVCGYLYQLHWPKVVDFKRCIQFGYGTILAHAKTVNLFHQFFKNGPNKKIGIVLNLSPTYPKDLQENNVKAAFIRDLLFNRSFLDPTVKNSFPNELITLLKQHHLLPEHTTTQLKEIKNAKIDFLGVNYYHPIRVENQNKKMNQLMPEMWYEEYLWPDRRINKDRGWEIYPKGIYDLATRIKNEYHNIPWLVTENGMGVFNEEKYRNNKGYIEDQYRIDFYKEHLYWLNEAIKEGSNCFGYHFYTLIDCWSWANAYKNRYGFVELDLKNQKRIIKKSGYWIKKVIENKGEIEIEE